jgi:hypothetical protein
MLSYQQNIETKREISEKAYFSTKQAGFPSVVSTNPEAISRLISAAVVDRSFRKLLLTKPAVAMTLGYNGEAFDLTEEDQALIQTIQAVSLPDFAAQLIRLRENNVSGEWIVRKPVKLNHDLQTPLEAEPNWKLHPVSTR